MRFAAFIPALILGVWLIAYTQNQANDGKDIARTDPFLVERPSNEGASHSGGFTPAGDSTHVILITSKRIEMPVFHTGKAASEVLNEELAAASPPAKTSSHPIKDLIARLKGGSRTDEAAP